MKHPFLPAMAMLLLAAAPSEPYGVTRTVALGGSDKWDYLSFDTQAGRVYVAHGNEITVLDGQDGHLVGHVSGLAAAHGVAIDPNRHGYAGTGRPSGEVVVFDPSTLAVIKTLPGAPDDDGVIDDPADHRVFVMNGDSESVTVIDTRTDTALPLIRLPGQPEFAAVDGRGKLFVNIADKRKIVRIDAGTNTIDATWDVADCVSPHGIAIDVKSKRIFTSCVDGRLIVTDSGSGARIASLAIGKGSDAVEFDEARRLVLSSNNDGTLSVIQEVDADHFASVADMPTAPGARTLAIEPETGRVFTVTADVAETLPPRAEGYASRYRFKPGSVKLLILDPVRAELH